MPCQSIDQHPEGDLLLPPDLNHDPDLHRRPEKGANECITRIGPVTRAGLTGTDDKIKRRQKKRKTLPRKYGLFSKKRRRSRIRRGTHMNIFLAAVSAQDPVHISTDRAHNHSKGRQVCERLHSAFCFCRFFSLSLRMFACFALAVQLHVSTPRLD